MSYLLGLDIATSAAKAVLLDEQGVLVGEGTADYPLSAPRPLWSSSPRRTGGRGQPPASARRSPQPGSAATRSPASG